MTQGIAGEENDAEIVQRESSGQLAIYSDIKSLVEADSNIFTIVSEPEEADIIWQADHWKNFDELRPNQLISQFPNEHLLTTKVCLSEVAKRLRPSNRQHPDWFSQSFDLKSEVPCRQKNFHEKTSYMYLLCYFRLKIS